MTEAEYVDDYKIRLWFSDGAFGCVDLQPLVCGDHRAIVQDLADRDRFRKFRVAMDTVVWDNGFDLAPEYLRSLI